MTIFYPNKRKKEDRCEHLIESITSPSFLRKSLWNFAHGKTILLKVCALSFARIGDGYASQKCEHRSSRDTIFFSNFLSLLKIRIFFTLKRVLFTIKRWSKRATTLHKRENKRETMPLFASSDVERRYLDLYYDEREVDVLQVRFLTFGRICAL